jgi:molybdate transport system substrate-binding protein
VVESKAVLTPSGRGADPVDRGEAEVGIAQSSEVVNLTNVDSTALLPGDPKSRTFFLGGVLAKSLHPDEAKDFLAFINSEKVAALKARVGLR